jgi:general stress protein YciG
MSTVETETLQGTPQETSQETPQKATEAAIRKARRPSGFATMDPALVAEIARKGGKAAHAAGTAYEFSSEKAREAGRKGGLAVHAKRRAGGA